MKQKISKKKREKNKNLKATVNGKQKIIDGLKKKLSFINENTTNSSEQLHEEIRKKQMGSTPNGFAGQNNKSIHSDSDK